MSKFGFVLGRWNFLHHGHMELLLAASDLCEHLVILIGSSDKERTTNNPLTFLERAACLEMSLKGITDNYTIVPVGDCRYDDDEWVGLMVSSLREDFGINMDEGSHPLYCFDRGHDINDRHCMHNYFETCDLGVSRLATNSTAIREMFFTGVRWDRDMTPEIVEFIKDIDLSEAQVEWDYRVRDAKTWSESIAAAPFPLSNNDCTDIIVYKDGEMLFVVRGHSPGMGKLAMPGGFVDLKGTKAPDGPDKSFKHAAARELKEETGLIVNDLHDLVLEYPFLAYQRGGERSTHVYSIDFRACSGELKPREGEIRALVWKKPPKIGDRGYFADHVEMIYAINEDLV